jgi:hypothetical protein
MAFTQESHNSQCQYKMQGKSALLSFSFLRLVSLLSYAGSVAGAMDGPIVDSPVPTVGAIVGFPASAAALSCIAMPCLVMPTPSGVLFPVLLCPCPSESCLPVTFSHVFLLLCSAFLRPCVQPFCALLSCSLPSCALPPAPCSPAPALMQPAPCPPAHCPLCLPSCALSCALSCRALSSCALPSCFRIHKSQPKIFLNSISNS